MKYTRSGFRQESIHIYKAERQEVDRITGRLDPLRATWGHLGILGCETGDIIGTAPRSWAAFWRLISYHPPTDEMP